MKKFGLWFILARLVVAALVIVKVQLSLHNAWLTTILIWLYIGHEVQNLKYEYLEIRDRIRERVKDDLIKEAEEG